MYIIKGDGRKEGEGKTLAGRDPFEECGTVLDPKYPSKLYVLKANTQGLEGGLWKMTGSQGLSSH